MSETLRDDRKLLQQANRIFDGLFTLFGKETGEIRHRKNSTKRRATKK